LPASPVWAVYYGQGSAINIAHAAATFKLIVIDADPGNGTPAFSAAQIAALKANGAKVLSYLNFGACEKSRTYWNTVPSGFVSCGANASAQISRYSGFQEYWMNPANADYQNLIVNYVAPRLAATGVDGFMLDNFEIVGHGANAMQPARKVASILSSDCATAIRIWRWCRMRRPCRPSAGRRAVYRFRG
jgi:cysteinyl-tRNA synthetase